MELRAATYYVKETKAPKGFQLDKNVYTMTVKAGETTTLKVSDTPKVADTLVELFKIDMETSKATPQGNASLEGAEFVWKYYDGYYTKDNLPSEPTRTWTTKTIAEKDSNNEVHYITRLADSYKVSGDSFYTQNGTICLPLGTITVEEKAAPNGYLLEGAYMQAAGSSEQIKGVYVAQITEDGELAALSGSNQYSVSGNVLKPVNCDYAFSELVNPIFIQDGEQIKASISVKYLDQRTKATQISQFDLTLEKDSNWKIVK